MYLIYMLMCWLNDQLKSLFNSLYTFILRACANERSSPGPFVVIIYRSSICLFRAVYVLKIKCLRNFYLIVLRYFHRKGLTKLEYRNHICKLRTTKKDGHNHPSNLSSAFYGMAYSDVSPKIMISFLFLKLASWQVNRLKRRL